MPPTLSTNGKLKKDSSEGKVRKIAEEKQKKKEKLVSFAVYFLSL